MVSNTFLVVVLLLGSLLAFGDVAGECMHDELTEYYHPHSSKRADTSLPVAVQDYNGSLFPSALNSNSIRIKFDLSALDNDSYTCYTKGSIVYLNDGSDPYTCSTSDILSKAQKTLLTKTLLPQAAAKLAEALKVVRPRNVLQLSSSYTKCGYGPRVNINSSYSNPGIQNIDLVLFITSRPITQAGVIAFGSPCQQDQLGRPIAGQLNFNPAYVSTTTSSLDEQLGTALHEITHVLGFTSFKFNYFNVNETQRPRIAYNNTQAPIGAKNMLRNVTKINTPAVLAWVRDYFGCPTLDGAELEDGGALSTRGSHWEKRLFANEYMTGSSSNNPIFSGLTLALLQDSGWYHVNYSAADPLAWGRGQGCDFVNKPCTSWNTKLGYHCSSTTALPQCSADLLAKAGCNVKTYSSTDPNAPPVEEQYFSDPLVGGVDILADYCPFAMAYSNGWCSDSSNVAANDQIYSQIYSNTSRCFMSTVSSSLTAVATPQPMCYPTYCTSPTQLKVKVGIIWYDCHDDAVLEPHTSFSGSFTCPNTATLCTGAAVDNTWPTVTSVNPNRGGPGDYITITGTNFNNYTTVIVYSPCDEVILVDNTTIIAKLSTAGLFQSLKAVAGKPVDVVVGDNRTGYNSFLSWGFTVKTGPSLLNKATRWIKAHPWAPAVAGGVVLFMLLVWCVKRRRRKGRKVMPDGEERADRKKRSGKKSTKKKRRERPREEAFEGEEEERTPKRLPRSHSVPSRKAPAQDLRAQSMKQYDLEYPQERSTSLRQYDRRDELRVQSLRQYNQDAGRAQRHYDDYDPQFQPVLHVHHHHAPPPHHAPHHAPPSHHAPPHHAAPPHHGPPHHAAPPHARQLYQPYEDPAYHAPPPGRPIMHAQYDNSHYYAPPAHKSHLYQPRGPASPTHAPPNHAENVDVDYSTEYYAQNQGRYDYA